MTMRSLSLATALLLLASEFGSARAQLDEPDEGLAIELDPPPGASTFPARPIRGPMTITVPGPYVVTRDISVITPPAITIMASGVSIDLNGKSVGTPGFDNGDVVVMDAGSRQLRIKNGRIFGGSRCIASEVPGVSLSMDHVRCTDGNYGVQISEASLVSITNSELRTEREAVHVGGAYPLRFEGNTIHTVNYYSAGAFFSGITTGLMSGNTFDCETYQGYLLTLSGTGLIRIEGNSFDGHQATAGLTLLGGSYWVTDNSIRGCRNEAIKLNASGSQIANNHLSDGGGIGAGIYVGGSSNIVSDNTVEDYTFGMRVSGSGNLVSRNVVLGSWETGITVSGASNSIDGNRAQSTYARFSKGLVFSESSSNNVFKDNLLSGNPGGALRDDGTDNLDGGGNVLE